MVFELDKDNIGFPDPHLGEEDGLLAVGGDLSIDRLLNAYSFGIFPWYSFREGYILWYCPMQRFVIFPKEIHISHSMRTFMNKTDWEVTIDKDFVGVIKGCSKADGRYEQEGAWLGDDMIAAYTELNRQGFAKSVEVWEDGTLIGGLYGVTLGKCFFGESMFSLEPNASKMALITLAQIFGEAGGKMIDCQFETPHLKSMGGRYISYEEYMRIVECE